MPAKKKQARTRKFRNQDAIRGLIPTPSIFPPMFRGKVTFADYPIINNILLGVASYVYRANSIYDPNLTGTGTTSYGVTQLAQLYDRYRVLNAEVHVDFTCTAGSVGGEVFVVLANNNTLGTALGNYAGQRFVWRKPIGPPTGNNIASCHLSFPIHKVYGVPKVQVRNEDDFASVMGNNPSNVVYIHIGFFATGAAATSTVTAQVRLVQDVVCSLPVILAP